MKQEEECRAGAVAVPLFCYKPSGLHFLCWAATGPADPPAPTDFLHYL